MRTNLRFRMTVFMLLGVLCFSAHTARASTATWITTSDRSVGNWTDTANWNAAQYPGQDAANQSAFLTNRVSGSVYKAVVDTPLPYPAGIVEVKNQGAGGEAWVLVTNAVFAATNLLIRTNGRLQVDNGAVTNLLGFTMDGTNGQMLINSGSSLFALNNVFAGSGSGGKSNVLSLGDNAVFAVTNGYLIMGNVAGADGNRLLASGNNVRIRTSANPCVIGSGSANNMALFTGTNIVWTYGNSSQMRFGQQGGNSNTLMISQGSLSLLGSTLNIGLSGGASYNALIVTNGGRLFTQATVGAGYSTSNNLILVTGTNSLWEGNAAVEKSGDSGNANGNRIVVDQSGMVSNVIVYVGTGSTYLHDNSLLLTNGAHWWAGGASSASVIGNGGSNNSAVATGTGTIWDLGTRELQIGGKGNAYTNSVFSSLRLESGAVITNGYVTVGATPYAVGNTMTVASGGQLFTSSTSTIGNISTNNVLLVTGEGTLWNCNSQGITVGTGAGALGNVLRIENGALVTNINTFTIGNSGANCSTGTVDNGRVVNVGNTYIGSSSSNNVMTVTGDKSVWNFNGQPLTVGNNATAVGNDMRITSGALATNIYGLTVGGNGGSNNRLTVSGGGRCYLSVAASLSIGSTGASGDFSSVSGSGSALSCLGSLTNGNIYVGITGATGSVMVVDNGGSSTGWNQIYVSRYGLCTNNTMVITNGGYVQGAQVRVAHQGSNSWNNVLQVMDGGLLETGANGLQIDQAATGPCGNNCITNHAGVYQFTVVAPGIVPVPANNSFIYLTDGTISFRAVTGVSVKGNWSGTLANISFSGKNAFRLNAATNAATSDQAYTFADNLGPTNYARLELFNGSLYRGGSVTIGSGGTLALSGTPSTITNLALAAGGTLEMTVSGTNSASLLNATGSVTLGGTLQLILAAPPPPAGFDWTLINKSSAGGITGQFAGGLIVTPAYQGTNYLFRIDTAGGSGNDLVLHSLGRYRPGTVMLVL